MTALLDEPAKAAPEPRAPARTAGWTVWGPGVLVALVLVVPQLGKRSLWMDESFTVGAINQLGATFSHTGGGMAPYFVVLAPWGAISRDPGWLRVPSLAFGLIGLVVLARLALRAYGGWVARVAGVVCAASLLFTVYSEEARSYTLVLALTVFSWLALDHLVETAGAGGHHRRWLVGFTVAWVLLPWAHGLSTLVLVAQLVALLVARPGRGVWWRITPAIVLAFGGTVVGALLGGGDAADWVPPFQLGAVLTVGRWLTSLTTVGLVVLLVAIAGGVAAGGRGLRAARTPRDRLRAVAPTAWGLLPLVGLTILSLHHSVMVSRYLIGCVPGLALLIALGLRLAGERLREGTSLHARIAMALPLVVVLLVMAMGQLTVATRASADWRTAADDIASQARPGDLVVFPERLARSPFEVAWSDAPRPGYPTPLDARPFGDVRYFSGVINRGGNPTVHLPGGHRIFVVFQPASSTSLADKDRLLDGARGRFTIEGPHDYGSGLQVWTLSPR